MSEKKVGRKQVRQWEKVKTKLDQINAEAHPNLEIVKGAHEPWAFTIKRLGLQDATFQDYAEIISGLNVYGYVKAVEHESDNAGKLHIHGIILLRPGFWRKHLCFRGYHTKLEFMYDEKGWIRYMTKDKKELKDINSKEYKNLYLFGPEPVEI